MKSFFVKFPAILALCFCCAFSTGCQEEGYGDFGISVKELGPDYVDMFITAPGPLEMGYLISKETKLVNPAVIFKTGKTITVKPGEVVRITDRIVQDTKYYMYAAAKLDAQNYSEVVSIEFQTKKYSFNETFTVVDRYLDGYKIHVTVPESVKKAGHVLRYSTSSLATYNKVIQLYGTDDVSMLVTNGGVYTRYIKNDSTLVYDNNNIYEVDENGEPIIDESTGEVIDFHDPISPGEPVVYLLGEFAWTDDPESSIGLSGWKPSYVLPCFNGWGNGYFGKYEFRVKEPDLLDAELEIRIPEDQITPIDAMIYFKPDENIYQYLYAIVDQTTYNEIMKLLNGNEDYLQWFLTSYLGFLELQSTANFGNVTVNAITGGNFIEPLASEREYYVLVTAMGDELGSTQKFIKTSFKTKAKTKPKPQVVVTAVKTGDPYYATFNIKAPNKDLEGAYYACNYQREWQLAVNQGASYPSILKGNYSFTENELNGYTDSLKVFHHGINTDEGLTISFPTLDGETSRLAVYGFNDEYNFNDVDPNDATCTSFADYVAPYADAKVPVNSELFTTLQGVWTASAKCRATIYIDGEPTQYVQDWSSRIEISDAAPAVPASLTEDVYDLYTKPKVDEDGKVDENAKVYTRDEVDVMFAELKLLTDAFTENRLENQNRLLVSGFIDFDYYEDPGRLDFRTPYNLFTATNYSSVDVPQIINDFGPKWFLEILPDGSVIVPFDANTLPPMTAWPGYPFYVGGYDPESNVAFYVPTEQYPGFPVEIVDENTIKINPIVLSDGTKEQRCYMNAIGLNAYSTTGVEIVAPLLSELTLTRGWDGDQTRTNAVAAPAKVSAVSLDGSAVTVPAARVYKSMTEFKAPVEYTTAEPVNVLTKEVFDQAMENYVKKVYNIE